MGFQALSDAHHSFLFRDLLFCCIVYNHTRPAKRLAFKSKWIDSLLFIRLDLAFHILFQIWNVCGFIGNNCMQTDVSTSELRDVIGLQFRCGSQSEAFVLLTVVNDTSISALQVSLGSRTGCPGEEK